MKKEAKVWFEQAEEHFSDAIFMYENSRYKRNISMGKATVKKYINEYVKRLDKDIKPTKVILYGSFLNSRFKEGSDIDLLVISEKFKNYDDDERLRILYRKTVGLPIDLHIFGLTPEEIRNVSSLTTLYQALRKGVVIRSS